MLRVSAVTEGVESLRTEPHRPGLLSVDDALDLCLRCDPRLKAGWEEIAKAKADWVQSSLKPNPTLSTSQTLMPLTHPFTVDRQGGPPQLDLGVAMPMDWFLFGKRAAAMVSARRDVEVSEAEYADLVRVRVAETAKAYFDAVEANGIVVLLRDNVQNLEEVERVTQAAVIDGGRPRVELSRIRLDRLAAQQSLRDAETAAVSAKASLNALVGRQIRSDVELPRDFSGPIRVEPLSLDEAWEIAFRSRPDLRSARWQIAKTQADMETERRRGCATVVPRVGYTRQFQEKAIGFPDADSWGVGLDVSLPLHDRNQGNRLKAAADFRQARSEMRALVVELKSDIEAATRELEAAVENATTVADEQVKLASDVRDSLTASYREGGRPLIDVLDAQRSFRDTYRLYLHARGSYWRAFYNYHATLGEQVLTHGIDHANPARE